jgi:phage terminase Nu1 subunit (DNA packaging protein)
VIEVNLDELAGLLSVSLPTAKKLVEKYPDMPVLERGGQGKAWRFDAEAVTSFFAEVREREEAERAARGDLLAQLTLPLGKERDKATGKELSLREMIDAAKLRKVLREEEIDSGVLVSTAEMRAKLETLIRAMVANQLGALNAIEREHKIPSAVMAAIRAKFDAARTVFVRDAAQYLNATNDEPGGLFATSAQ